MAYRYKWKEIKEQDLYKRWRVGEFRYYLNLLKKNKTVSEKHPIYDNKYDLRSINLRKTRLPGLKLFNCDINNGQFYSSELPILIIKDSLLIESDLTSANLSNSEFHNCNFTSSSFKRAHLSHSKFINCDLSGVDFTAANIDSLYINSSNINSAILWKCRQSKSLSGNISSAKDVEVDLKTYNSLPDGLIKKMIKSEGKIIKYEYDIAISFAGEDRKYAEKIAKALSKRDVRIFYDDYERGDLWGKNLYDHLTDIYKNKAKFCLILISKYYAEKIWTNLERKAAQARAFQENEDYILPLQLDDTEIKGILPTVGYIRYQDYETSELITMIKQKLEKIPN